MRCMVSWGSTWFPWLVFFFGALLWGSMIHKHTGRWMWPGRASVGSWNWEKCSCSSKLVSTMSMLLSSVLSWRVSLARNPRQLQLSPGTWSLWPSQASVHLHWSSSWSQWCFLPSTWSSQHWSPCRRLWRLCWHAQLLLPVLLLLLLSHQYHQQNGVWWLFCLNADSAFVIC